VTAEETAIDPATLPAHNFGRGFETVLDLPDDFQERQEPAEEEWQADDRGSSSREVGAADAPAQSFAELDDAAEPARREPDVVSVSAEKPQSYSAMLTVAVIALAVALGWLLGESVERQSQPTVQNRAPAVVTEAPQTAPTTAAKPADGEVPLTKQTPAPPRRREAAAPKREVDAPQPPAMGELVVSQNGKVIYRQEPSSAGSASAQNPAGTGVSKAVMISSETANQYVVKRVEPEYPEQARADHISGPVTLEAIVAKDGSVKTVKTISGDPELAAAARQAVSQWQFKPFTQQGKPAEFQTKVTVNFRLPN
jgi:TonB family protein